MTTARTTSQLEQAVQTEEEQEPQGQAPATPAAEEEGEELDADHQELADAEAAAAAEEAEQEPEVEGEEGEEGEQQEGGEEQPQQFVPLNAVLAEREKRQAAERELERLRGFKEGVTARGGEQTQQQEQQRQPTVADIDKQIDALSDEFDEGKINMRTFKERERALQDQRSAIIEAKNRPQQQGMSMEDIIRNDSVVGTETDRLVEENPWLKNVSEEDLKALEPIAYRELAREGVQMKKSPRHTIILREKLVEIGNRMGYAERYAPAPARTQQRQQQQRPQGQGQGKGQDNLRTQPTVQQRKAKIAEAGRHPPAPSGVPAPGAAEYSDDDIADMSEDEIAALPASVRDRIAPSRAR